MALTLENAIIVFNQEFPDYPLTVEDMKKSLVVMGALLQIFNRLGVDVDALMMPPDEKELNENIKYYRDLVPVINVTRVINHLVGTEYTTSVNHFLQPMTSSSRSLLIMLFNLMLFNEERLQKIASYEEEMFHLADMVKALEDMKNKLFSKINQQAEEIGKRQERMVKMTEELKQHKEELGELEELCDHDKRELVAAVKENQKIAAIVEQKKAPKAALMAELDRKKALRVYDADDIKGQVAQAAQNVREADEKLSSLGTVITQKENCLKTLQMIKPNLDVANELLHGITKLTVSEMGDLDADSKDGEQEVLSTELMELRAQHAELAASCAEADAKRQSAQTRRRQEQTMAESAAREAEEKDRQGREASALVAQRTIQLEQLTLQSKEQREQKLEELRAIKDNFTKTLKVWEDALIKLMTEMKKDIKSKEDKAEDLNNVAIGACNVNVISKKEH